MSQTEILPIDQKQLAEAWSQQLPQMLKEGDRAEVRADESDAQTLRIHIQSAGHSEYSFDFICTYLDTREVQVTLVDVERGHRTIDERSEVVQQLVDDYVRHIHECAQALKTQTNV